MSKGKQKCLSRIQKIPKERKGKILIFNAQAFKSITKGKTILHIVCRARGQRNCDFRFKTAELSSSFHKCVHPISLDHMSPHFPMTDWCSSLGAIWRSEKSLSEFDMRARGEQGEGKSSWGLGQVSHQPYCTEIISHPPNRDEFKIICCIRGVQ